jgi:hypothetical protein
MSSDRPLHSYVNHHDGIEGIAFFILNENIRAGHPDFRILKMISKDVFGDESRANQLSASIASYFLKSESNDGNKTSRSEPTKEKQTEVINNKLLHLKVKLSFHKFLLPLLIKICSSY